MQNYSLQNQDKFGCVVLLSMSYLNQKYQLPVHQYILDPYAYSPQTSKVMWQFLSDDTDGSVVKVSVLRTMKYAIYYLEVMDANPSQVKPGVCCTTSKSNLNQHYLSI